jgi:hypothetical protein
MLPQTNRGVKQTDHLFLSRRADSVHVDRAFLDHVKSLRRIALVKQISAFGHAAHAAQCCDFSQLGRRQTCEQLARP